MRFEKCLTCPSIKEKTCTGPKFMRASTKDLIEWLIAYQRLHGITNATLAAASGIPKGTIDGLKNRIDVRHETMVPLLKAAIELMGGIWDGDTCPLDHVDDNAAECQQEIINLKQKLERAEELLAGRNRLLKVFAIAMISLFGICAGLIALLLVFHL